MRRLLLPALLLVWAPLEALEIQLAPGDELEARGYDAAYDPIVERKSERRAPPVWLSESPDSQTVLDKLR